MNRYFLLLTSLFFGFHLSAQNVGVGTTSPQAKLHIKGNADTSQLTIDAGATQSNTRPLIRLRNASGADLMHIHSDSEFNVFMGFGSGRSNSIFLANQYGLYNTFIGSNCGYFNSTGSFNTGIGRSSLYQNTQGNHNTGLGYKSLFSATTAFYNTAVGSEALLSNIQGNENTAIGWRSLHSNTSATGNTAVGSSALYSQSHYNGGQFYLSYNTAVGAHALFFNQPTNAANGSSNVALGGYALYNNTSGSNNTASGTYAGFSNTSNSFNSFFGERAGFYSNTSGNTGIGQAALSNTTFGFYNVALGWDALLANVTGHDNTALGTDADVDQSNSNYNTMVGGFSHVAGSNNIVIGYNAYTNSNGLAQLGNTTTVFCGGYANWTNYASHRRVKTAVNDDVKGLDFILRLRPVTYNIDVRAIHNLWGVSPYGKNESKILSASRTDIDNSIRTKEAIRMSGFIAQEVEKAAKETGYDFDGIKKPENDKDHYGLSYATFVVPLVKAMQEQQVIIEKQNKEMNDLKARLDKLEKLLAAN